MALEATHLRFALDLKDKYKIKDIKKYISGVVYPDSRYITGIDRELTHPSDYRDWLWDETDDFRKGWFVHLLTDETQSKVIREKLPQVFAGVHGQGSDVWVNHSAIKVLLDLDDVKKFDIKKYLPYLSYVENPNGEDLEILKKYNQIFTKMYANLEKIDIDISCRMWADFGVGHDLVEKVRIKTAEYSKDASIMKAVSEIYQDTINNMVV
jgi:hypothetical protein